MNKFWIRYGVCVVCVIVAHLAMGPFGVELNRLGTGGNVAVLRVMMAPNSVASKSYRGNTAAPGDLVAKSDGVLASESVVSEPDQSAAAYSPYLSQVATRINQMKRYPSLAMTRGQQGVVTVSFSLDALGDVSELVVAKTSRIGSLDRAALHAVRSAAPFGPVPAELSSEVLSMVLDLVFVL